MASITRLFAIASLALAACAGKPDATECATGITCPAETKCAAVQAVCITNNCGDGIQQQTEECDDGNILDGDGCAADCRSTEVCGDMVISSAAGEICDDGNTLGGDGCAMDCKSVEVCGNMIRDVGEACDDGNTVPGDGCSGNCRSTEVCGNGIVDVNEKCDDAGAAGGCNDDCQGGTGCRDGAIDKDGNGNPLEECDDGNMENQDNCTNTCKLNRCGDGIVQTSGLRIEGCDPSVSFGETNDCNIDCTVATCGDGKINNKRGEQCDDKNVVDEDACKNDCKLNVCGDGVEGGPNEACDTAGDSLMCDVDCSIKECGDDYVNLFAGEECDSGAVNTALCDANCTLPKCGDGTPNDMAGEQCDDMNLVETDNCLTTCKNNTCGDGFRDMVGPDTEACDFGLDNGAMACDYGMQSCLVCNGTCTVQQTLTGNVCGDGVPDASNEMCDDGNTVTETACPYGQASCTSFCSDDCDTPLTLSGPFCGDGMPDAQFGEACDDRNGEACGRCDASCNVFASAAATGYIVTVAASKVSDEDRITISDGLGTVAVFELDNDDDAPTDMNNTNIPIDYANGDTAEQMQSKIRAAINGAPGLRIDANDGGGNLILLVHQRKSSLGNVAITETVGSTDFVVSGMSGGAGGNCAAMKGCTHDDDCTSGSCTNNKCD